MRLDSQFFRPVRDQPVQSAVVFSVGTTRGQRLQQELREPRLHRCTELGTTQSIYNPTYRTVVGNRAPWLRAILKLLDRPRPDYDVMLDRGEGLTLTPQARKKLMVRAILRHEVKLCVHPVLLERQLGGLQRPRTG